MICTYFEPVDGIDADRERDLLALWKCVWPTGCVVSLNTAKRHPLFSAMQKMLEGKPEVTPPGYRDQCFFRWLAFDLVRSEGAFLAIDYDVIRIRPTTFLFDRLTVLDGTNPCAVFFPKHEPIAKVIGMLFQETKPDEEPCGQHLGDNTVFGQHWQTIGDIANLVSTYPETEHGLVHFPNRLHALYPHGKEERMRSVWREHTRKAQRCHE